MPDQETKQTEIKKGAPKVAEKLDIILERQDEMQKVLSILVSDVAKMKSMVGFNDQAVELPKLKNYNPDMLPVGGAPKTLQELGVNNRR